MGQANLTPLAVEFNSHVTESVVRAGLNYKFDPFGVVYDAPKGMQGAHVTDHIVRVGVNYKFDPNALWAK
jgi:hypothetical protein